ncbi:MAG: ATP-binding protein [Patescibacteria group bacterium]
MKIHLPNSAFLGTFDAFLKKCDFSNPQELFITAHPSWISIHPAIIAMMAALSATVQKQNIHTAPFTAASAHHLERMGLFTFLGVNPKHPVTEHESAGRFIPLQKITSSEDLSRFITDMVPLLHLDKKHAEPIKYVVSEIVRNVLEHAHTPEGAFICAQYYRKSNRIGIGIADTGIGVLSSINHSYDAKNDLEALQLALMPGITGTTKREGGTEQNAGAGLFFTKSIATVNRNHFVIYSGSAMYKLLKPLATTAKVMLHADPFADRHSKKTMLPYWQGTVVGFDISLDTTKEFSQLLDLIRDTYAKALAERKRTKYRKPQFI